MNKILLLNKLPEIDKTPPKTDNQSNAHYTVKVTANTLNYRKGPGINYPVVGLVRKNEVYTIVQEEFGLGASKWGKLNSGAGWISLDHCVKTR